MKKISLILPVYNVEQYLPKCIESCLCQDLPKTEYEIIIVIDGSLDNSLSIAKKYQQKYSCISIVERPNGGLSAARNTGLKHATGEYVWFIDSDDYINKNILNEIFTQLQQNKLDALWVDWQDVNEKGKALKPFAPHYFRKDSSVMSGHDFMANVLSNFLFAWSFIYRRSFLMTNQLLFTEGMFYEDSDFAFRSLPIVQRIKQYNKVCYNYLQRANSIVHHIDKKKLMDLCKNCLVTYQSYLHCSPKLKRFYRICYSGFYMKSFKDVLKSDNKELMHYFIDYSLKNKLGQVGMYGNFKTKAMGLLYNVLGVKTSLRTLWLFLHKFLRQKNKNISE